VCAWKRGGPIENELLSAGVPTYVHKPSRLWTVLSFLDAIVKKHKIDVIHGHMSDGAFWGGLLSRQTNLPLVLTYHSNRLISVKLGRGSLRGRLRFWMLKSGARRARINIACGDTVKERVLEELDVPDSKVEVVRNGVPLVCQADADEAASERRERSANATGVRVVTVGRLDTIKGQHQLIEAAPQILGRYPESEFTFVGDGPRLEEHRALATRLGVEGSMRFVGLQRDVAHYLQQADVYAATSEYEGLPLSVVEAMGWLLPVVATDVVGNRDLVKDEVTGLLYPFGDADKLASGLMRSFEDQQLMERTTREARKLVTEQFSVERMAREYAVLYERACNEAR